MKQGRLTLEADFDRFHGYLQGDAPLPEPEPEPETTDAPVLRVRSRIEEL